MLRGYSHLSLRADEDVLGLDISYFLSLCVEGGGGLDYGVDQVPQFHLLEELALDVVSV